MSDFYESLVPFWTDRDDRELARDLAEHDLRDAAHEAYLDARDRELEMVSKIQQAGDGMAAELSEKLGLTVTYEMRDILELDQLPIPTESTGLCVACRACAALPDGTLCADCSAEVFGDAA